MLAATAALAACVIALALSTATDRPPAAVGSTEEDRSPAVVRDVDPEVDRPNVLLLTLDDLSEGDLAAMPQTRELLADEGTTLSQGLAPTPICAPARASLLTGQYAHNHGVLGVEGEGGGFDAFDDRRTLPVWLSRAGYDTMFAGKYLNGYGVNDPTYVPPGWHHWRGSIDFSTYFFFDTRFNIDGRVVEPTGYNTDVLARYTNELLRQHRRGPRSDDPWFLWVNYVAPHHGEPQASDDPPLRVAGRDMVTTVPAPRHENMFSGAPLPDGPAMWERNVRGNQFAADPAPREFRAVVREAHQQRLESLQAVDEAVGRTIATLRRTGELQRTVIVLTSDNGFLVGQHNRFGKLVFYDDSLRIPMIVRGPGVPRGEVLAAPVTNPDLAVTIAGLAHARPTRTVDGIDVWPWLTGTRSADADRVVPIEAYPAPGGRRRLYSGIRYGELTYVRARNGHEELYDRGSDPGELTNVVDRPAYRAVLRKLRRWDRNYRDCAGRTCPRPR